MPINGLDKFIKNYKLIRESPLDECKSLKIGIDCNTWLSRIHIEEPLLVATGGYPLTLFSLFRKKLEILRNKNIEALFVLPGISVTSSRRSKGFQTQFEIERDRVWKAYIENGCKDELKIFGESSLQNTTANSFQYHIVKYLIENGQEVFRSPLNPLAQLSYFVNPLYYGKSNQHKQVDLAFGPFDLLMFGAPKVIIDFDEEKYYWVSRDELLHKSGINLDQFIDACILAGGFERTPTFSYISENFVFEKAVDLIHSYGSGINAVSKYPQYRNQFLKMKSYIQNNLIFDINCRCYPAGRIIPADIHSIVGFKLPDEAYWMISLGTISIQIFNNLFAGVMHETPPQMDTNEYRLSLNQQLETRAKTLALLTSSLGEFFIKKKVFTTKWFDATSSVEVNHSHFIDEVSSLSIFISDSDIEKELLNQKCSQSDIGLSFVLRMLSHINCDLKLEYVSTENELYCSVMYRALLLKGLISKDQKTLTSWGKGFSVIDDIHYEEYAFILLDLLRMEQVHSRRLTSSLDTNINHILNEDPKVILLSRVFSLLPMELRERMWESSVDYDLIGFNCIVKSSFKTTRYLLEMIFFNMFINGKTKLPLHTFQNLLLKFPFYEESNVCMGIVIKYLLKNGTKDIKSKFPCCVNIKRDVKKGIEFWSNCVIKMIEVLKDDIKKDTYESFMEANNLLESCKKEMLSIDE